MDANAGGDDNPNGYDDGHRFLRGGIFFQPRYLRDAIEEKLPAEFLRRKPAKAEAETAMEIDLHPNQTTPCNDLIQQILLLLPAESLLRVQLTCKLWSSFINTPLFVQAHALQSDTVLISRHPTPLLQDQETNPRFYLHCLSLGDGGTSSFLHCPSVSKQVQIRASCDGLILAASRSGTSLQLMNPTTGKHIDLPPPVLCHAVVESFGIAYCMEAKTYKVVHLFRRKGSGVCCEVMNIRSRIWTRIEGPHEFARIAQLHAVSIKGSLHWLSNKRGNLISVDMKEEKFVVRRLPLSRAWSDKLVEMGEDLGYVGRYAEMSSALQVWVLKGGKWMKMYEICRGDGLRGFVPICSRGNGREMVVEEVKDGGGLWIYSFERGEMEAMRFGSDDGDAGIGRIAHFYIPHRNTLVSCTADHSLL